MDVSQMKQYVSSSTAAASATSHSHNHPRLGTAAGTAPEQYIRKPSVTENSVGRSAGAANVVEEMGKKKGPSGQPESTINDTIQILLDNHIVENRKLLNESWINLDKIANYCDANYLQVRIFVSNNYSFMCLCLFLIVNVNLKYLLNKKLT